MSPRRLRLLAAGDGVAARRVVRAPRRVRPRAGAGSTRSAPSTPPTLLRASPRPVTDGPGRQRGARRSCSPGSTQLAPVDRALLAGFLLGDTRGVPDDSPRSSVSPASRISPRCRARTSRSFWRSVAPFLRRLSLRGRLIGGVAVLVLFGAMTRWEPSVLPRDRDGGHRAGRRLPRAPHRRVRVLVLAATALLVADPFLLHSVGFLLSCGGEPGHRAPRPGRSPNGSAGRRGCARCSGVTAAAQVGVAPILIPVFGSMPLVALPANLIAVPLAAPLTMWGLASGVVGGLLRP